MLGMATFGYVLLIVTLLTVLGSATLILIVLRYYWGDRGKPPLYGEARRIQKEKELKEREAQLRHAERNKWPKRVGW